MEPIDDEDEDEDESDENNRIEDDDVDEPMDEEAEKPSLLNVVKPVVSSEDPVWRRVTPSALDNTLKIWRFQWPMNSVGFVISLFILSTYLLLF